MSDETFFKCVTCDHTTTSIEKNRAPVRNAIVEDLRKYGYAFRPFSTQVIRDFPDEKFKVVTCPYVQVNLCRGNGLNYPYYMSPKQIGVVRELGFTSNRNNIYRLSNGSYELNMSSGFTWDKTRDGHDQRHTLFTFYRVVDEEPPPPGWKGRFLIMTCKSRTKVIELMENDNDFIKGREVRSGVSTAEELAVLACDCGEKCVSSSKWQDCMCTIVREKAREPMISSSSSSPSSPSESDGVPQELEQGSSLF